MHIGNPKKKKKNQNFFVGFSMKKLGDEGWGGIVITKLKEINN